MQRIRLSLPYFLQFGWEAEVVTVDDRYSESVYDKLLLQNLPETVKVHKVRALNKQITSKVGLGSLALRAFWFYMRKVNTILTTQQFDLIYFSTTQFPICVLGAYWKKKFGVPYVIDFQDPWHSEYYLDKAKSQRPPKFWFSYRLNKYLEPVALKQVDGLISVSAAYLTDLCKRYSRVKKIPSAVIPFGFDKSDLAVALKHQADFPHILSTQSINLVYIGRGGEDMHRSIIPLFEALSDLLTADDTGFSRLRIYFIGTSYAPNGSGKPSIIPLAHDYGIQDYVTEITDRIPFYHTLATLQHADALFIPGSDDAKYTASKLYPYLLSLKPILAIFNNESPALKTLHDCGVEFAYGYNQKSIDLNIKKFLKKLMAGTLTAPLYNQSAIMEFEAVNMTRHQCDLFQQVLANRLIKQKTF